MAEEKKPSPKASPQEAPEAGPGVRAERQVPQADAAEAQGAGADQGPEPYGAQLGRLIHSDYSTQLPHYHSLLGPCEHPKIRKFAEKLLADKEKKLTELEALFLTEYGHLPPLDGAMEGDAEITPLQPDVNELAGTKGQKSLTGAKCLACGKDGCGCGTKSHNDPKPRPQPPGTPPQGPQGQVAQKDLVKPGKNSFLAGRVPDNSPAPSQNQGEEYLKGAKPLISVLNFFGDIGKPDSSWGEEKRMHAYHLSKMMEDVPDDMDMSGIKLFFGKKSDELGGIPETDFDSPHVDDLVVHKRGQVRGSSANEGRHYDERQAYTNQIGPHKKPPTYQGPEYPPVVTPQWVTNEQGYLTNAQSEYRHPAQAARRARALEALEQTKPPSGDDASGAKYLQETKAFLKHLISEKAFGDNHRERAKFLAEGIKAKSEGEVKTPRDPVAVNQGVHDLLRDAHIDPISGPIGAEDFGVSHSPKPTPAPRVKSLVQDAEQQSLEIANLMALTKKLANIRL